MATPAEEIRNRTAKAVSYWSGITEHFNAEAEAASVAATAPPSADDIDGLSLDAFGEQRAALGIRHQDSDFIGLSETDDQSGFPSWRNPVQVPAEQTELDTWAREERTAAGVPDLNDFGLPPRTQRVNASPWTL
jgi:hypothetical protein